MKARRACELCSGDAALHCESDSAFLCWACDGRVHGANFLVARHARRLLCAECGSFDDDDLPVYGPGVLPLPSLCRSCHGGAASFSDSESSACSSSSLASSMSSSCVSSAESWPAACAGECRGVGIVAVPTCGDGPIKAASSASSATDSEGSAPAQRRRLRRRRRRRSSGRAAARAELDARANVVLACWCRRLGLEGGCPVDAASHALRAAARRMAAVPFRACAAAAVWYAAKLCCAEAAAGRGAALLRRLEACSGVPAKLIVVAEARLSRAVRRRHAGEEGEGWAECS